MIKEVKTKKNVIMVNKNHERGYGSKQGVMIIEEENGKKHILDLKSNTDISTSDYIDIVDTKKTKEEILFKNIMLDTETLEKLARGGNLFKIKEKTMQKCFDKIIAPLDIINQIGNESEMELVHELNIDYVKKLENGLIKALDELSQKEDNFDYYDKLRELTDFGNYQALDFLDMFSDNEGE